MKSRSVTFGAFFPLKVSNVTLQRLTLLPHILKEPSANQLPGREADDSLLSSAEIRYNGTIPPLLHAPSWRDA